MKSSIYLLLSVQLLIPCIALGQGGWDIGYVSIDSIDQQHIGKDIKLDFRAQSDTATSVPRFLMGFIGKEDTAKISIDDRIVKLIEVRDIHVDWGFYDQQFLECRDYGRNMVLRVYHSVIENVKTDSLLVRLYMETSYKDRRGRISDTHNRFSESAWIRKEKLNGVMVKK